MACVESFKTAFDAELAKVTYDWSDPGLEAAAPVKTVGLRSYIDSILAALKTLAKGAIDTEEERDQIKDYILTTGDLLVGPKLAFFWPFVRRGLDIWLDEKLDKLAVA